MTNAPKPLLDFQLFQKAFTQRIRDPQQFAKPDGLPAERMALYQSLIFDNLYESVSQCFPVARSILGEEEWSALIRRYFSEHATDTPIFREIPETFVQYLSTLDENNALQPDYLLSLCHYEWIELSLSTLHAVPQPDTLQEIETAEQLLDNTLVFISPMMLLQYDYAVHEISSDHVPQEQKPSQLLVYRNEDDIVKFVVLNAMTYMLIQQLSDGKTARVVLTEMSATLNQSSDAVINFGLSLLSDLTAQAIIIGFIPSK